MKAYAIKAYTEQDVALLAEYHSKILSGFMMPFQKPSIEELKVKARDFLNLEPIVVRKRKLRKSGNS